MINEPRNKTCLICSKPLRWYQPSMWLFNASWDDKYQIQDKVYMIKKTRPIFIHNKCADRVRVTKDKG